MNSPDIRPLRADDLPALKSVVDATGLFPSEHLDDMVGDAPDRDGPELWLTAEDGGRPVALAYCAPEPMTDGTWNLLLIAVHPSRQGRGIGAAAMRRVEDELAARGARVLLVDTSALPGFARTRAFYRGLGYEEEARIREYWAAGDDKVVFRKAL